MAQGGRETASLPSVIPDFNADPSVDVEAFDKYEAAVRQYLNQRKFSQLDELAASLRSGKTRFKGGPWKLYVLYRGLKQPDGGYQADDTRWENHLAKLAEWTQQNPNSVTSWTALAEAYFEYSQKLSVQAEAAQGQETPEAEEERWETVNERVHAAKLALRNASKLSAKCPHFYFVKQKLVGEPNEALLREAQAFEPDYYYFYRMHALFLQISQDPELGAAEKFADAISDQIGGVQGSIVYYEIAAALNAGMASWQWPKANLSWDKVQRGYADLKSQYGTSVFKANQMAFLALRESDMAAAEPLFAFVGDQWDRETWGYRKSFENVRRWVMAPAEISTLRKVASANQKTTQGQQYYKPLHDELERNYASTYTRCAKPLGADLGGSFDLLLRIGGDGEIQEVKPWPLTNLSTCLAGAMAKGKVTAPPAPSYWLRIPFQL